MALKHRIRLDAIFKTALSVSLIVAGICLMAGCIAIYSSDADQPYTREIVAQTFKKIAVPVYICLALIVITFIGALTNPQKAKGVISKPSTAQILKLIAGKRDINADPVLTEKIMAERKKRKINTVIFAVINSISALCFLFYALNPSNFDRSDINGSMISAMLVLVPCLAVSFAVSLFFFFLNKKSMRREIELLKTAPLKNGSDDERINAEENYLKKEKKLRIVRLALLTVFICLAVIGFITGGTADVLTKAVNICTECIGLG